MRVSASRPGHFISKDIPPGTHRIGNLGPRTDMGQKNLAADENETQNPG